MELAWPGSSGMVPASELSAFSVRSALEGGGLSQMKRQCLRTSRSLAQGSRASRGDGTSSGGCCLKSDVVICSRSFMAFSELSFFMLYTVHLNHDSGLYS